MVWEENSGPTGGIPVPHRKRVSLPLLHTESKAVNTQGGAVGPVDVVGTGETGAGGRQSGRSPRGKAEVEHEIFLPSASTVAAGCVGAGIS